MPRLASIPTLFALAVLSLGLAGCGAAEPRAEEESAAVRRAGERTAREATARFEIRYAVREGGERFDGTCNGSVRYADKRYRVLCEQRQSGARAFVIDVVSVGGVDYVRFEGDDVPVSLPPDKRWLRLDRDDGEGDPLRVFDPVALLEVLRSATRKTEHLGAAEVRGVATEYFRLTVDRKEADLFAEDEAGPETIPVELWIDGEGVIRRMRSEIAEAEAATIEFFDFGAPVEIEAPPPDQVGETTDGDVESSEPKPCAGGATAPLTDDAVTTTLGEHRIDLVPMPNGCDGDVAVSLANLQFGRRGDNAQARPDVPRAEALVICRLRRDPPAGAGSTVRKQVDPPAMIFSLANLECSLYPEGERAEAELRRLEQGLRALERTLR